MIRLPSFNQHATRELAGRLQHIPADVALDARTEVEFYKLRVTIAPEGDDGECPLLAQRCQQRTSRAIGSLFFPVDFSLPALPGTCTGF